MYAIRSYYAGGFLYSIILVVMTLIGITLVQFSIIDRITSYNVCYTKLLRDHDTKKIESESLEELEEPHSAEIESNNANTNETNES